MRGHSTMHASVPASQPPPAHAGVSVPVAVVAAAVAGGGRGAGATTGNVSMPLARTVGFCS